MEELPETLQNIGLSKNESKVYLALLRLGTAKTGEILEEAGLNSGRIYDTLNHLKNRGLVSESKKNNVKHFTAAPPDEIIELLEKRKEEIDDQEDEVRSVMPQLKKLRKTKIEETNSMAYTGFRGIKTAIKEAMEHLEEGEETLGMGITSEKDDKFNRVWRKFQKRRGEKDCTQRVIFSEQSDYYRKFKEMPLTEARVLESFTPVTVDVFGDDTVLILNYSDNPSCILIYDENTATSFREFFNQMWQIAEEK